MNTAIFRYLAAVVTALVAALLMTGVQAAPNATAAVTNPTPESAIVTQEQVALRSAPRDSAPQQAVLWPGELLEVRGERLDFLQVYDHKRERAGFVRASQVRRTRLSAAEAPELLAVLRFVRDASGPESLGLGLAAAYLQAAPAATLQGEAGTEALDALGSFADRLARRASSGQLQSKAADVAQAAYLEVAAQYGVRFNSYTHSDDKDGRMHLCYDGDAFRRVLALPATPEQRARAALALTRADCADPQLNPQEKMRLDDWRAEALDRVDAAQLPGYLQNRVLMRRASVWGRLAFHRTRLASASSSPSPAQAAANRALAALASVNKAELTEDDASSYNDAAMRVNASRWAAAPASALAANPQGLRLLTTAGEPGETCLNLLDAQHDAQRLLARRCTYSVVWANSATVNREGNALAVAVQPMDSWRELWVFRKDADGWHIAVLPPATTAPDIGFAEFAGWVPGGTQMLVAREARGEGKYKRSFELVRLDTLSVERQSGDPAALGAFQRWQDPSWKRMSVSVR